MLTDNSAGHTLIQEPRLEAVERRGRWTRTTVVDGVDLLFTSFVTTAWQYALDRTDETHYHTSTLALSVLWTYMFIARFFITASLDMPSTATYIPSTQPTSTEFHPGTLEMFRSDTRPDDRMMLIRVLLGIKIVGLLAVTATFMAYLITSTPRLWYLVVGIACVVAMLGATITTIIRYADTPLMLAALTKRWFANLIIAETIEVAVARLAKEYHEDGSHGEALNLQRARKLADLMIGTSAIVHGGDRKITNGCRADATISCESVRVDAEEHKGYPLRDESPHINISMVPSMYQDEQRWLFKRRRV